MPNKPLVSVIIVFFNTEKFIQETIESVFTQTYDNFELLLVDDGSTDRSTEIAQSYVAKYPNQVLYLEHENHQNQGISATRNLGIRHAKGEFIAFLDADDVWLPNKLEDQVAILESHPDVAMVYCGVQYWYSWTERQNDYKRDWVRYPPVPCSRPIKQTKLFSAILTTGFIYLQANLLRRSILEKVEGFEDAFKGLYDDQVLFVKLSLNSTIIAVDKYWCKYRQHPQSICYSAKKQGAGYEARRIFLLWVKQYLSQQKIRNWLVWLALQREFLMCLTPTIYTIASLPTYRWRVWYVLKLIIKPILPISIYERFTQSVEEGR